MSLVSYQTSSVQCNPNVDHAHEGRWLEDQVSWEGLEVSPFESSSTELTWLDEETS